MTIFVSLNPSTTSSTFSWTVPYQSSLQSTDISMCSTGAWSSQTRRRRKSTTSSPSSSSSSPYAALLAMFSTLVLPWGLMSAWAERNSSFMISRIFLSQVLELCTPGILDKFSNPFLSRLFSLVKAMFLSYQNHKIFPDYRKTTLFDWWIGWPAGISDSEWKFRKQRNFVTMWYNMAIWASEVTAAVLVVSIILRVPKQRFYCKRIK